MNLLKETGKKLIASLRTTWQRFKKLSLLKKILISLGLILLIAVAGVFGLLHSYYNKSHYVSATERGAAAAENEDPTGSESIEAIPAPEKAPAEEETQEKAPEDTASDGTQTGETTPEKQENPEETQEETSDSGTGLTAEEEAALIAEAEAAQSSILFPDNGNVYNILLIGVDQRREGGYANSDSMILLSLNKETRRILMISFMRDLYCNIEGVGVRKLNAAHAIGGPDLLVKTIEDNYKVDIDNYARVNFFTMIDLVDKVGGIELDITEEELPYVNRYVKNLCGLAGVKAKKHYLDSAGTYLCDGYQTVAYSRIRYVGSDYQRTQRQRTVLTKLIEKARTLNLLEINDLVSAVLPDITHDISEVRMLQLLSGVPAFLTYDIAQSRVPYADLYVSRNEILYPEMETTIARLQEEIYGQSYLAYGPSPTVSPTPVPETEGGEGSEETAEAQEAPPEAENGSPAWWEQVGDTSGTQTENETEDTDMSSDVPVDKELYYVRDVDSDGTVVWQPTLRDKVPGSEPVTYPVEGELISERDN